MAKFLDLEGLNYFWEKIKSWVQEHFASKNVLNQKQDKLVSGQNIRTINNQSIVGSGNINIQTQNDVNSVNGKTGNVVLTAEDVGALSSFTETDPTVPDWAKQSSKPSYTQDEISEGETNKSYTATEKNKLSGIAAGAEVNVQANWNESDASSDAYIWNKPKVLNNIVGITTPTADGDYITVTANTPLTGMASIDYFLINFSSIGSGNDSKKVKILFTGETTAIPLYNAAGTTEIIVSSLGTDWWLMDVVKTNNKCYLKKNFSESSGEENIIESISVNGTTQTITNKNVDITVPTTLASLSDDATHRVVTDTEKSTWSGKSNFSGSYDDLTDKPTLFSGNYNDLSNKPTIPTVPTDVSAFNNDAGYLTSHQDITGKADKVSNPTSGNFAGLDSNGNLTDSGSKASDFVTSTRAIPSGGNAGQVLKKVSATDYDVTWANQSETLPSAYCTTSGSTAAKKANCSLYVTQANQYLQVLIGSANTYQGELTLNINSAGAKPIYINGTISSSNNYTLPNGTYFVFYDGTNYYFRTDGKIQGPDGILYNKPSTGIPASDLASEVISDISGKEDRMLISSASGTTLSAVANTYHNFTSAVNTLTITLPAVTDVTHITNIVFMLTTGTTPAITFAASGTGVNVIAQDGFSIEASTTYEINALFNGTMWVVAAMKLSTTPINS